jgi:hypothetical protein
MPRAIRGAPRMAPKIASVRALLERAPGRLVRGGAGTCFRAVDGAGRATGHRLRGITKRLHERVFSSVAPPVGPSAWRGSAWRGADGGLRRGRAVDAQVSRLSKLPAAKRGQATQLKLTRLTFAALQYHGLAPVTSQRVVLDDVLRLATAVDVVCLRGSALVLVELKCGFGGSRSEPARLRGRAQTFARPFHRATDCHLHRHFAQLAATAALFDAETATGEALQRAGVESVAAALLYVNDDGSELHELPSWWRRRGDQLLATLC